MSAGMSCTVNLKFHPKLNQDINTSIYLLTNTGQMSIPIVCLKKRCAPRVVQSDVQFGDINIGQVDKCTIKIINSQALSTTFKVVKV